MSYSWIDIAPITYTGLDGTYITPQIMKDVLNNFQYLNQQLNLYGYGFAVNDNTSKFNGNLTHPFTISEWVSCLKNNFKNLYSLLQNSDLSPFAYEELKEQVFTADGKTRVFNLNDDVVDIQEIKYANGYVLYDYTESNGIITTDITIYKDVVFTVKYYSFQRNFMLMTETEKLTKFNNILNYMTLIKNIANKIVPKTAFLTNINGDYITDINNKRITVYQNYCIDGSEG